MIAVLNIALWVFGVLLFRACMRMSMSHLWMTFWAVMFCIVAFHLGYRLITGHWLDPAIKQNSPEDLHRH